MAQLSRRQFVASLSAIPATLTMTSMTKAIDPIQRTGPAHIKLSLAAYSFHRHMALRENRAPAMTMDQFAEFAAGLGLDAIEPTSYYFADTSEPALAAFRAKCTRLGLDISGTAVGNDFCKPAGEALNKEIDSVKQWIDRAVILGAKTIRIFAGSVPRGDTEENARRRCIEAIETVSAYAGKFGILLALENHGGITSTAEQLLAIVQAVQSPWFGVNLDTGNFHTADPYQDLAKIAPYAVVVQVKTEVQPKGAKKQPADFRRILSILREAGFRGYASLEYEAAEDPKTAVPRAIEELRKALRGS
jgi:sugar phosphate isomerase/epimerase